MRVSKPIRSAKREVDWLVLEKYKQVYEKYRNDGVIDMEQRMKLKFDFQIYRLEDILPKVHGVVPTSRQYNHWIVLVKQGGGEKVVGHFTFPIQDYTLIIIPKRVINSSVYNSVKSTGYVMSFNVDYFLNNAFPKECIDNRKVLKQSMRPYLYLDKEHRHPVRDLFERIYQENLALDKERDEMIAIKVLELLIYCDRLFAESNQHTEDIVYHPVIEKFSNLVESHYHEERSVQYYADLLNVHPNHLNYLLKKHSGLNAKKSIDNRIMLEAKYLLSNSTLIVKEIAHRVGFSDPNHFSTFFQKNAGMSPATFRSTNAQHPSCCFFDRE